jgi:four helix bundle protein
MGEIAEQLKAKTKRFALDVCSPIKHLPHAEPGQTVRRQLAKSATSVAFNYRASCRARSHAEYTAKIGVVAEEADESLRWLEFIEAARLLASTELERLIAEAPELTAIMSASHGTARYKERNRSGRKDHGARQLRATFPLAVVVFVQFIVNINFDARMSYRMIQHLF